MIRTNTYANEASHTVTVSFYATGGEFDDAVRLHAFSDLSIEEAMILRDKLNAAIQEATAKEQVAP